MIRINLLPSDGAKAKRSLSLPSISGGAVLWGAVGVVVYVGAILSISALQARSLGELEKKITVAKEESAQLAPQLAKIRKLTKEREEVSKRLNIIASLDRDRYLRVQLMNDLSMSVPGNLWLTNLVETGGSRVELEGYTFSNFTIADLMANMEKSKRFQNVALKVAEEGKLDGHKVVKFTVSSRLVN